MTWNERLKAEVPKQDIPTFLIELQALVAALREERPWQHLLTDTLRRHQELALAYMDAGPKRDAVAAALR